MSHPIGEHAGRGVILGVDGRTLPPAVGEWLAAQGTPQERVATVDEMMARALRSRPAIAILDARGDGRVPALAGAARLKADSFTGIVPTLIVVDDVADAPAAFDAGADEVVHAGYGAEEIRVRLCALIRRSVRDTGVHPTTRLPGTVAIEGDIGRRIAAGEAFAACYADLDHFKEYNDRYGYNEGDRVIRMLALVLHDVVKGVCGEAGFVGHIGGDDFFFVVPLDAMAESCSIIVETFETLVPFQYSEADRRAGYYFGKDRRGQLHRVPLMSVSIGVVTTERRTFVRAAQVSALASEMKSYAKAQPGSGYYVDRRTDGDAPERGTVTLSEERA